MSRRRLSRTPFSIVIAIAFGLILPASVLAAPGDADDDGIPDGLDNCLHVNNPDQTDSDGDHVGDVCDNCRDRYNPTQRDTDGDGSGNACSVDPGTPGPPHEPFVLPFAVTDAVADPNRPYLYVSDRANRKVRFIDLVTGMIDLEFGFEYPPESLAISPDGSRLFVSLPVRDHSSTWYPPREGYIASFDLDRRLKDREFHILDDPYDLLATSDGYLVVSSGSGTYTYLRVVNADDGTQTASVGYAYERARLSLDPLRSVIYAAWGGSYMQHYDLRPGGGLVYRRDSPYYVGRIGTNLWVSPGGEYLVSSGGDVFGTMAEPAEDMLVLSALSSGAITDLDYDGTRNVIFSAEQKILRYYNRITRLEIGSFEFDSALSLVRVSPVGVCAIFNGAGTSTISLIPNPAPDGESNTAPRVSLVVAPGESGDTTTTFRFDASGSADDQESASYLQYRWDIDGDGTWDGPFEAKSIVEKRYDTGGPRTVRVQVADSYRLVDDTSVRISVAFAPDPGSPGPENQPYSLPFVPADAAADPSRPYLYVSDKSGRRVCMVNLQSGFIERQFLFDQMPERMALTPDGTHLFVALLTREHDWGWPDQAQQGFIASFDLAAQVKDNEIQIPEDPFELLATSDGHLVVTSGSGQWTTMRVFDALSGAQTGSVSSVFTQTRVTLHPSERFFYTTTTSGDPESTVRYNLLPGGGLAWAWFPYPDDFRPGRKLWASPLGDTLIGRSGGVFAVGPDKFTDLAYISSLSSDRVDDLAFDAARKVIFAVQGSTLRWWNLVTRLEIGSQLLDGPPRFVRVTTEGIAAVIEDANASRIVIVPHPALNGATNLPPSAVIQVSPATGGSTSTNYIFDASASSDDQDSVSGLRFRWDLDGDGTWDGAFAPSSTITTRFAMAGTKFVHVQIRDSLGLLGEGTIRVDVGFVPDPGSPGGTNLRFELPFAAADVAADPRRPYLYATDKPGRRLAVVNLLTGVIDKLVSYDEMPESLALAPDGNRLFVALLTREHDYGWMDYEGHVGDIASYDLATQTEDRRFRIAEDPFDIVATSDGRLVVSSGSGQWTKVRVFDAMTGALGGTFSGVYMGTQLSLYPSEHSVYTAHRSDGIHRYDLPVGDGIVYGSSASWRTYPPGSSVWASPLGDVLVGSTGEAYATTPGAAHDFAPVPYLTANPIADLDYDATQMVIFTGEGSTLHFYNLISRLELGSQTLDSPFRFVRVTPAGICNVTEAAGHSRVTMLPHPVPNGASNTAPEARLAVTPEEGGTQLSDYLFDASASSDAQDPESSLRFRWDLDGDGAWDGPFTSSPTIAKRFDRAGTRWVRVQVRDTLGLVAEARLRVDVAYQASPGDSGPAFDLPFPAADVVIDRARPYLYATDKAGRRIVFVDLRSGIIEKTFTVDLSPESLAITPDGARLFAALLTREHNSNWPDWDHHTGAIVSFDLVTGSEDRQFGIAEDPYDLAATSDGRLIVPSGSGQNTSIRVFDARTGAQIGSAAPIRQMSHIALHPSEGSVYTADTDVSPSNIFRFNLVPGDGIVTKWGSPYHGSHRMAGNVWASPVGDRLISRGGDIFTVGQTSSTDIVYVRGLSQGSISDIAWDVPNREFFTIEDQTLRRYSLTDYTALGSFPLGAQGRFAGKFGKYAYGVMIGAYSSTIRAFGVNHPPAAAAGPDQSLECSGDRSASIGLDGTGSSDPDSSPGTQDDLASYNWLESGMIVADGASTSVDLGLGVHDLSLRVTDGSGLTATDQITITIADTLAPSARIESPAPGSCWGSSALPVVVSGDFSDRCDPAPTVSYDPPTGPGFSDHGDHTVRVTVRDEVGNASSDAVSFTIDTTAPTVQIHAPIPQAILEPEAIPLALLFTTSDEDGAAGGVVHETVSIQGCLVLDGATYGNGDGVLSDESVSLDLPTLCAAAQRCGLTSLVNPSVRVEATDCGGNVGSAEVVLSGGMSLGARVCSQSGTLPRLQVNGGAPPQPTTIHRKPGRRNPSKPGGAADR